MILTRYLYNLQNVKVSLFMSLIDRNIDEALFWGYEIYHSGFYEDIIDYLVKKFLLRQTMKHTSYQKNILNLNAKVFKIQS